jgi:NitT/TauT family transport system ATP-binding protein
VTAAEVVLAVEGLTRRYACASGWFTALEDVWFEVLRGELLTVIGPSGCGKSTLIRIIAGLDRPSQGIIRLDARPVRGPGADRGMVFQQYTLFPWLKVRENVAFGPRMAGVRRRDAAHEAERLLAAVGLERFAGHYPHQLSGGMRQRVAIARALANRPRILLMDEPFGALDAQTRAAMQSHLLDIREKFDVTILFITHDLDEAAYMSDRIVVLEAQPGRVAEIVPVPLPRPRPLRAKLLPEFRAVRQRLEALIHPNQQVDHDEPEQVVL